MNAEKREETEMTEDKKQIKVVRNSDNESLMPRGGNGLVVGYVDRVNGRGAEEINGFTPTRNELIELVKYWYGVLLDNRYFSFLYAQSGSREIRENPYAQRRIDRLAEALGHEDVDKAIAETEAEFSENLNPEHWEIFKHGDKAQWAAFQDQIQREIDIEIEGKKQHA